MSEKTIQMNRDGVDDATASMSAVSISPRSVAVSSEKTIQVRCGDGRTIELDDATAFMSESLKFSITSARRHRKLHRITYKMSENPKMSRIPSQIVEKIFQYCERHAHADSQDDRNAFDAEFYNLDPHQLCKLSMAALRLKVPSLEKLATSAALTVMARHMTLGEVTSQYHRHILSVLEEFS